MKNALTPTPATPAMDGVECICWYRNAQEYAAFRALCRDAAIFPKSFHLWRENAKRQYAHLLKEGVAVVKVEITPAGFLDWLAQTGSAPSSAARVAYAQLRVQRHVEEPPEC